MTQNNALHILKLFYYGVGSIQEISRKAGVSRAEVREVLRGARSCGMIEYGTQDSIETLVHVRKKGLEKYLRTKGVIK